MMMQLRSAGALVALAAFLMSPTAQAAEYWYPTVGGDATWAFEDLWPAQGDYDFNDLVVRYRLHAMPDGNGNIHQMNVRMRVVARGASHASGFAITVPVLTEMGATITIGCETRPLPPRADGVTFVVLDNASEFLTATYNCAFSNTTMGDECPILDGREVLLKLYFDPVVPLAQVEAGLNPFLFRVGEPGREVHLPGFPPSGAATEALLGSEDDRSVAGLWYMDAGGRPWALDIPGLWDWPIETTDITVAYEGFADWVQSAGQRNKTWWTGLGAGGQASTAGKVWNRGPLQIPALCDNCADVFCPSGQVCVEGVCESPDVVLECTYPNRTTVQRGTTTGDVAQDVAVDAWGNVFATGVTSGGLDGNLNLGTADIFLTKWNAFGAWQWTRQWGSSGRDSGEGVAVDADGNIYVTGAIDASLYNPESFYTVIHVSKWTTNGIRMWNQDWGAEAKADSVGKSVALDPDGNVYVAGTTYGGLDGNVQWGISDLFVAKLTGNDGSWVWTYQRGWPGLYTRAEDVAVDPDDNGRVYVAGNTNGDLDSDGFNIHRGGTDAILFSLLRNKTSSHFAQWGTSANDSGLSVAIEAGTNGGVYVAGDTGAAMDGQTHQGGIDGFLVRWSKTGVRSWTRQFGTTAWDMGQEVAVDGVDGVFVTGFTEGTLIDGTPTAGSRDVFLGRWDTNGGWDWTRQWGTAQADSGYSVFVDGSKNIYVAGSTKEALDGNAYQGNDDLFVSRFTCEHPFVDECADGLDTCDANATCVNIPEGFACDCDQGFVGDGGDSPWVQVAAGQNYSAGIKADSTLWAWGSNSLDSTGPSTPVPVQIGTGTSWRQVSVSSMQAAGVSTAGSLWVWGDNRLGALGLEDIVDRSEPVPLDRASDWAAVSVGNDFMVAIKANGTMWAWGSNEVGQLGLGSFDDDLHTKPIRVGAKDDWVAVAAGNAHVLALDVAGELYAWGFNYNGECGCLPEVCGHPVTNPTRVGSDTWQVITANQTSLAIRADGSLWAWGYNGYGGLCMGDDISRSTPTRVGSAEDWTDVEAGYNMTMAIRNETVYGCGMNRFGELGFGSQLWGSYSLLQIPGVSDAASISAGERHSGLLTKGGQLWTWGGGGSNDTPALLGRAVPDGWEDNFYLGATPGRVLACNYCPLVDECAYPAMHNCVAEQHQVCVNTRCGFVCECESGYWWNGTECVVDGGGGDS